MFAAVLPVRQLGGEARTVADRLFFETVVRIHRAGEGAPYGGLKPAGTPVGPVLPLAERAVQVGSSDLVAEFLTTMLRDELDHRLQLVKALAAEKDRSVTQARRYVSAMLGFEVYCHHLYKALQAPAHESHGSGALVET